ncbi:S-layer protein [Sporosarcina sp. NCCP-2716]|uniref:S-layer homology domain-containing protein n=1 Tax=Sporosarcina sp. NCCP-2716 TaxID=2943679 RepID=UPI00203C99D1|nr:S-layer homology domain-containing protein [Sporosarcina sp. NCCP-2716]GKV69202.1 S-layer protein [Sporosarcina sp. NCCP-2716]
MTSQRIPAKLAALLTAFLLLFSLMIPATKAHADELTGRTLEKELREMIDKGILSGYSDGSYRPAEEVSRGQFAAFIARALKLPDATGSFQDVPKNSKLAKDIYRVQKAGIMGGYSGGIFKPDAPITREQVSITMMNVLNYSEMVLQETRIDFTDLKQFQSSGSVRAAYYNIRYGIISGIPNKDGSMRFEPKANATREQAAAFISRFLKAVDAYEPPSLPSIPETPEQPPVPEDPKDPTPPTPEPPVNTSDYYIATISNGKLVKQSKGYAEYLDAANEFNKNSAIQAMYRGNEIVRVRSGFAFGDNFSPAGAKENTIIYKDYDASAPLEKRFKNKLTYIQQGREMKYLGSNDEYIRVQVGATEGYVKHSETDLIPAQLAPNRDHYTVSEWGTLTHHIYNYMTKEKASYYVQLAPDFLKKNGTYYSPDGVHFYDTNQKFVGTFLPYFQFLSARSTTSYTGAELDSLINKVLKDREKYGGRYANASKNSKLVGLGKDFKKLEQDYNINALLILSLAVHEGDYGISETALKCNNLFGLYKYDSLTQLCLKQGTFDKPIDSAVALVNDFLNPNYMDPANKLGRAQGAAFGNKTTGFNVNYASDPTWGAKAGAHMYDLDKAAGGKDYGRYLKFALTNVESTVNVRKAPGTSSPILYTYTPRYNGTYAKTSNGLPLGYPLTVISETKDDKGNTWYEVFSDDARYKTGYISADVVTIVNN